MMFAVSCLLSSLAVMSSATLTATMGRKGGRHNAQQQPIMQSKDQLVREEINLQNDSYNPDMVEYINSQKTTWTAHANPRLNGHTEEDVKDMCGTIIDPEKIFTLPPRAASNDDSEIPESFDSRTHWSDCASVIGHIRDQASCGSCWAFGSTSAFNDRLCIASKGDFKELLSVQQTTSCCNFLHCFSFGCNGGQPGGAWRYFKNYGIVTGGDNPDVGSGDSCYPYEIPMCSHHVQSKLPACKGEGPTPKCKVQCSEKNYGIAFNADKQFADSAYSVSGEEAMQREIMENGPITVAYTVYADFPTYKSGVYQHVTGGMMGGHAVKMIGWGVEKGTPYWIINNSWNNQWGDDGTFKILRGKNECGIENAGSAGKVTYHR